MNESGVNLYSISIQAHDAHYFSFLRNNFLKFDSNLYEYIILEHKRPLLPLSKESVANKIFLWNKDSLFFGLTRGDLHTKIILQPPLFIGAIYRYCGGFESLNQECNVRYFLTYLLLSQRIYIGYWCIYSIWIMVR